MGSWDYALAWLIYFSFGCVFAWQLHRLLTNWGGDCAPTGLG